MKLLTEPFDINLIPGQFNRTTATTMAKLSWLAYSSETEIKKMLEGKIQRFHFFDIKETDTQGYFIEFDGFLILVLRGTEPRNTRDWRRDFDFRKVKQTTSPGKVHRGFGRAANSLDFYSPDFVTGHSLGGGIASLCCQSDETYTFGAPRVGNKEYAAFRDNYCLHTKVYRIVNDRDLVPRVPMRCLGYRHFGEKWLLKESGELERWGMSRSKRQIGESFHDHFPEEYVRLLEKGK